MSASKIQPWVRILSDNPIEWRPLRSEAISLWLIAARHLQCLADAKKIVPSPLQAHRSIGKQVVRDVTTAVASITIAFGGMTNVSVFVAAANSGEDDRQYGKTIDHVNGMTKCVKKYFRRCAPALR
jgi:hypothetical protein